MVVAAQPGSCVLRGEGRTGKGSGVGDGVGASRGVAVGRDGRNARSSEQMRQRSRDDLILLTCATHAISYGSPTK